MFAIKDAGAQTVNPYELNTKLIESNVQGTVKEMVASSLRPLFDNQEKCFTTVQEFKTYVARLKEQFREALHNQKR